MSEKETTNLEGHKAIRDPQKKKTNLEGHYAIRGPKKKKSRRVLSFSMKQLI